MALIAGMNSLFALRQLDKHNSLLNRSLERLSSGYRINRAADDPAGLGIADKLRTQIRGLQQAAKNITQATSFIRTAEDGMTRVLEIMLTIRDLSLEATNSTLGTSDRTVNQTEINELLAEIDRLATAVKFNGIQLLNGSFSSRPTRGVATGVLAATFGNGVYKGSIIFHVGANENSTMRTFIATQTATSLGVNGISVSTQANAYTAATAASVAVSRVLSRRARLSGVERRLETAKTIVDLSTLHHQTAESNIMDADTAGEIVSFTREQILIQAATAMIAQSNLLSQSVLKLLLQV